jgi:solute carrier family 35 protein F5
MAAAGEPDAQQQQQQQQRRRDYLLGLFFILCVALLWSASSILVQWIYADLDFDSPFFVTYLSNILFALYLPLWAGGTSLGVVRNPPWRRAGEDVRGVLCSGKAADRRYTPIAGGAAAAEASGEERETFLGSEGQSAAADGAEAASASAGGSPPVQRYSHLQTFRVGMIMTPLWFLANCSYNMSLSKTSITSSTIISTTSTLWTFCFAVCAKAERFSTMAVVGVLMTMAGSLLTGLHDQLSSGSGEASAANATAAPDDGGGGGEVVGSVWGDVLSLFSAMMYGVYSTTLRVLCPDDEFISMPLMFGYLGVCTSVLLFPILAYLLATGELQGLGWGLIGWICLKSLGNNVLADYFWARAVVLTSPTVVAVGLSITVPLAFLSDFVLHQTVPDMLNLSGAALVVVGFTLVNLAGGKMREAPLAS